MQTANHPVKLRAHVINPGHRQQLIPPLTARRYHAHNERLAAVNGSSKGGQWTGAYSLRRKTWPSRTTTAIPSPTMDDAAMGPKARESHEPERLSPST